MPAYPLPSYPGLRKHHNPEWGQSGTYLWMTAEDGQQVGDELPCFVHHPDMPADPRLNPSGHSADEKYWNVVVYISWPPTELHPGKILRKAGVFWKEGEHAGYVTSGACGPPYPG